MRHYADYNDILYRNVDLILPAYINDNNNIV